LYIAVWVPEEDKSNNKKNPAPPSSKEAIYLTAYIYISTDSRTGFLLQTKI
jgi:hypothetical protein